MQELCKNHLMDMPFKGKFIQIIQSSKVWQFWNL